MIRLHVIVEGQTEERFVKDVLSHHLGYCEVSTDARCVINCKKRHHSRSYKGGLLDYKRANEDITRWMREDDNIDSWFTSMFDLYALPENFPGFENARRLIDSYHRVNELEKAFARDMNHPRFVPYIQLHEFEALILSDPSKFAAVFTDRHDAISQLTKECASFETPKFINDGESTAPSKRIIKQFPEFDRLKVDAGLIIARAIGIETIREKCLHFSCWLKRLERLK